MPAAPETRIIVFLSDSSRRWRPAPADTGIGRLAESGAVVEGEVVAVGVGDGERAAEGASTGAKTIVWPSATRPLREQNESCTPRTGSAPQLAHRTWPQPDLH